MKANTKTANPMTNKPEYQSYRVLKDEKPTGFTIKSENEVQARRQLAIAAQRMEFSMGDVTLVV